MTRTSRRSRRALGLLLVVTLIGGLAGLTQPTAVGAPVPSGLRPEPCPVPAPAGYVVSCGSLPVPADHDDPDSGRVLSLAVAVIKAQVDLGKPPLLILSGGPGDPIVLPVLSNLRGSVWSILSADRDVVVLDQRGAGLSTPALDCPELTLVRDVAAEPHDQPRDVRAAKICRDRLVREGVSLEDFTTEQNVRDMGALQEALGVPQVDVFGTSYGARLALQLTRGTPSWVRAVVLNSPIPAQSNFVRDAASSYDRALRAIGEACARERGCAQSYPDVIGRLARLTAALDTRPASVQTADPDFGFAVTVPVTGPVVAKTLFSSMFANAGPRLLPYMASRLATDRRVLRRLIANGAARQVITGQQLSFLCAEEGAGLRAADLTQGDLGVGRRNGLVTPVLGPNLIELCRVWEVPAATSVFTPIRTDVPLLSVSGALDQVTPPSYGVLAAESSTRSFEVTVPWGGHGPLLFAGACGPLVVRDFLDDPTSAPNTACLVAPRPFPTPTEVPRVGGLGALLTA